MANVKISELPVVTSVTNSDVLPVVASTTTSQLTMTNLAKSMPQVSSSISASFATTAFTATSASYAVSASFEITYETSSSYADFAVSSSYAVSSSRAVTSSFAISSSFAVSASWAPTTAAFPFTGSARITGSAQILGPLGVTGSVIGSGYIQAENILAASYTNQIPFGGTRVAAFGSILRGGASLSTQNFNGYTFYYQDTSIGHSIPRVFGSVPVGAILFARNYTETDISSVEFSAGEGKVPIYTIISDNYSLGSGTDYTYGQQNGRNHVLTVSGSILSKNSVSLGSNLTDNHIISGSVNVIGGTLLASGLTQITGSLGVTGSVSIMSSSISLLSSSFQTSVVVGNNKGLIANYIYPVNYYNFDWNDPTISATDQPGFPHFYPAGTNPGFQGYGGVNYYFADVNIGQSINSNKAGVVKLLRDTTTNLPDVEYFTLVSNGNNVSDSVTSFRTANGRNHTLTVTGSLLARDGVTLGTNIQNQHYLTGSLTATGSLKVTGSLAIDTSGSFILPGTASANPVAGNFYFDFTNNKLYAYNGSNWVTASLGI